MRKPFEISTRHGLRISGLTNHPSSTRTILALHGWLDNANSFLPLMDSLPEFNIIAVDLPGHGRSDHKPTGNRYHFIDSIEDVLSIADALKLERFDLMGHSMGAGIAPLVAAAAPERVGRLICIEGLGPLSAPAASVVEALQTHLRQLRRLPDKKFPVYRSPEEAVMARMLAGDIADPAARLIVERGLRAFGEGVTWNTDARLRIKSAHPFTEEQICGFMAAVQCATLVVRAVPGYPFSPSDWEGRRASLKNVRYLEVAGNHHVHMDDPATLAQLIRDFYEQT